VVCGFFCLWFVVSFVWLLPPYAGWFFYLFWNQFGNRQICPSGVVTPRNEESTLAQSHGFVCALFSLVCGFFCLVTPASCGMVWLLPPHAGWFYLFWNLSAFSRFAVCLFPFAVCLFTFCRLPFHILPSAFSRFAVCLFPFAVCLFTFALCLFTFCCLPFHVCRLPFHVCTTADAPLKVRYW